MKYLVLSATVMGLLILSPVASADGRYGRGYDRYYDYGFYGRDRFRGYGHYRNRYPVRYRNYYRPGGTYWNFSFGSRHRHSHFDGGALLGGLVLGSILGHSAASSRYDRYTAPETSRVRVINRSPVVSRSSGPQRRLLRDLAGRCYEISVDGTGNEMRIELDPSACDF